MTKQYTHTTIDGKYLARIVATDVESEYPVVVALKNPELTEEVIHSYSSDLKYRIGYANPMDLIRRSPWEDVKVDTRVQVRTGDGRWINRYFSHYADGIVYTFLNGANSWSAEDAESVISWEEVRLAE